MRMKSIQSFVNRPMTGGHTMHKPCQEHDADDAHTSQSQASECTCRSLSSCPAMALARFRDPLPTASSGLASPLGSASSHDTLTEGFNVSRHCELRGSCEIAFRLLPSCCHTIYVISMEYSWL